MCSHKILIFFAREIHLKVFSQIIRDTTKRVKREMLTPIRLGVSKLLVLCLLVTGIAADDDLLLEEENER